MHWEVQKSHYVDNKNNALTTQYFNRRIHFKDRNLLYKSNNVKHCGVVEEVNYFNTNGGWGNIFQILRR